MSLLAQPVGQSSGTVIPDSRRQGRVARSHCRRACGMGGVAATIFGKHDLLQLATGQPFSTPTPSVTTSRSCHLPGPGFSQQQEKGINYMCQKTSQLCQKKLCVQDKVGEHLDTIKHLCIPCWLTSPPSNSPDSCFIIAKP